MKLSEKLNFHSGKCFLAIGLSLLGAAAVGGTYAYYSNSISVENRIQFGDIDISLKEYQVDKNGWEHLYRDHTLVSPGDTISKIPRITSLAQPCYVRARITHSSSPINSDLISTDTDACGESLPVISDWGSAQNHSVSSDPGLSQNAIPSADSVIQALEYADFLSDENIIGLSEDWIRIGDYYYYKNILNPHQSVDLFHGVSIPEEWDNSHAKQELSLNIQIDAIQSDNFSPDFASQNPWGDEEIEICVHSGDRSALVNPYTTMYVEFEGNSHKLVAVPSDFFSNIGTAMPGDQLSDTVLLKNTTKGNAELFFHTALPDTLTREQKDLLKQIALSISLEGNELYRGDLESASLHSDISLGTYPSQSTKNFDFTLTIPPELKNQYALADTIVRWVFSVHQDGKPTPAATGDTMMYLPFLLAGIGGIISISIYFLWHIRTKRKERGTEI